MSKIDNLGRVVIPIIYRKALNLKSDDVVEITMSKHSIIITPYAQVCKLCGREINRDEEIQLCQACIRDVKKL